MYEGGPINRNHLYNYISQGPAVQQQNQITNASFAQLFDLLRANARKERLTKAICELYDFVDLSQSYSLVWTEWKKQMSVSMRGIWEEREDWQKKKLQAAKGDNANVKIPWTDTDTQTHTRPSRLFPCSQSFPPRLRAIVREIDRKKKRKEKK